MSKTEEVIGLEPVTQKKPKGRPRKYLLSRKERRGIEEQADLLAELEARYKQNPLKWFVPTGAQEDFIKAMGGGGKLIGIDSGANRVGKTALMVNMLGNIVFGPQSEWFNYPIFGEWPYAKNARIGTNPTNLSEIGAIQKGIEEYWPQGRYTAVKQGKTYNSLYKTDTGWTIDLMSYDQSVKEWESVKLSLVLFDEPPPEPILSATQARLADGGMILIFMTPLGDAGYIFDNLIENPDMKDRVMVCYSDIESSCKEHGIRGFREHKLIEDLVKSLSPEDLEARAHGKPMHLSGSIYKIFNQSVHIIDDFGIPDDWYRVQVVDPHDAFPFGMLWAAFSPTQNCYIYKEYPTEPFERIKGTNLTFDDYKDIIITAEYKENIGRRIMDPNFGAKRYANTGKTVRGEMFDRGFIYELCRTDDLAVGHNIVRDWLSYDPSKPLGMGNDPKLKIFRSCRNTWVSMIRYGWKPNLKDEHSDSLKLVQKYKHFADMVRYLAVTNPMYEAAEKTKYAGLSGLDRKVAEEIDNLVAV